MNQERKLQETIQSFLDQLSEEEIASLLEPCQRLTIKLSVLRGHTSVVVKEGSHKITKPQLPGVREALFVDLKPIGKEHWEQIFELPIFSESPGQPANQRLRQTLRKLYGHGTIPYSDGCAVSSQINQILEANNIPCRMVIIDDSVSSPWDRHFRICELK